MLIAVLIGMLVTPAFADGGGIRGTIHDGRTGQALAGVTVTVNGPAGAVQTLSDRNGFFVFLGVVPGVYVVGLLKPGYYSLRCTQLVAQVSVHADEVFDVALELVRSPHVISRPPCLHVGQPERLFATSVDPDSTADVYNVQ